MNICIVHELLSDGSMAHNVVLKQDDAAITLLACSCSDAAELAVELYNLVVKTTVSDVKVVG